MKVIVLVVAVIAVVQDGILGPGTGVFGGRFASNGTMPRMLQLNFGGGGAGADDMLLYAEQMDAFYDNYNELSGDAYNATACGTRFVQFSPRREPKIIGGMPAIYGAYPWQVQIQMFHLERSTFSHHCGGAVIGERLILTAAHCLQVHMV